MTGSVLKLDVRSEAFDRVIKFCERDQEFAVIDRLELHRAISNALAEEAETGIEEPARLANAVIGRLRQDEQIKRSRSNLWFRST